MKIRLKPCPFCGSKGKILEELCYRIVCTNLDECGASSSWWTRRSIAIMTWNRRAKTRRKK